MKNEPGTIPAFFSELAEAQKARDELMKWKLIVISALGSAGLGFFESKNLPYLHLILALIPLACVYIDVLCRNLSVRTKRINQFISSLPVNEIIGIDIQWTNFYKDVKKQTQSSFESLALLWSTSLISIAVLISGFFMKDQLSLIILIIGGSIGIVLTIIVERRYRFEKKIATEVSKKKL